VFGRGVPPAGIPLQTFWSKSRFYFRRALSFESLAAGAETCVYACVWSACGIALARRATLGERSYSVRLAECRGMLLRRCERRPLPSKDLFARRLCITRGHRSSILHCNHQCLPRQLRPYRRCAAQRSTTKMKPFDRRARGITSIAQGTPTTALKYCPVRRATRSAAQSTAQSRRTPPWLQRSQR
jgi:hypothetical protein